MNEKPLKKPMTPAERQRASRARRKKETFESFTAQQLNVMLSAEASQALSMLTYKHDKSRKAVIDELLIDAYKKMKAEAEA